MNAFRSAAVVAALTGALVAQAPINDTCTGFAYVVGGVNPSAPGGVSGQMYNNVNATDSAPGLFPSCVNIFADVFFTYIAYRTGTVTVKTCNPPGFVGGTLTDTVVAVYLNSNCPRAASRRSPATTTRSAATACSPSSRSSRSARRQARRT
jgi:hypothetical protein